MDIQFLKMNITNKKLLIVSHDAGGAEILSSYLIAKKIKGDFILSGPAKKIFKEKNLSKNLINKSPKIFDYDAVITSTSINNKSEILTINKAKKKSILTISFLDHWTNYKRRFLYKKNYIFPDIIVTHDLQSYNLAKLYFKKNNIKIKKEKNFYFNKIKNLGKIKKKENFVVLLPSNYDRVRKKIDHRILQYLVDFFLSKKKFNKYKIIIKPHPSESIKKYKEIQKYSKNHYNKEVLLKNYNLTQLLKFAKYVAGSDTMGLVVGKLLKCKTINLLIKKKTDLPSKYIDTSLNFKF